ncbi:phosphoglycolate phosphatase [Martelella mediterranea]|uniref:phosphoglycolate phosphatase n=1 Tax=Martelella mediterranea TaxID=293089 RepID=UPI001E529F4E|nr:phosphoglycolate phosphatase [Martelella mediterranea]MCD1634854.1 phosphoglycolate phosphatase [Martelella mediterranea]
MPAPLAIFDLDGTLIDTAPDLIASLNHAIAPAGLAPYGIEDTKILVGRGVRVMIERAFEHRDRSLDEDTFDACFERFSKHYRAGIPGESRPYPGIVAALDRLKSAGFDLAVCTNKRESFTMPLLEALGLTGYFTAITGGDTFAFRKPDPRHITETIARAGGDVANAVMVGDSSNDIDSAKGAGVATIAVTFGYADRPVADMAADRMISDYAALTSELALAVIARQQRRQ